MKKVKKCIVRNLIWITAGLIINLAAVDLAYMERGYAAIGGEWLVLPAIMLLAYLVMDVRRNIFITDEFRREVDAGDGRTSRNH